MTALACILLTNLRINPHPALATSIKLPSRAWTMRMHLHDTPSSKPVADSDTRRLTDAHCLLLLRRVCTQHQLRAQQCTSCRLRSDKLANKALMRHTGRKRLPTSPALGNATTQVRTFSITVCLLYVVSRLQSATWSRSVPRHLGDLAALLGHALLPLLAVKVNDAHAGKGGLVAAPQVDAIAIGVAAWNVEGRDPAHPAPATTPMSNMAVRDADMYGMALCATCSLHATSRWLCTHAATFATASSFCSLTCRFQQQLQRHITKQVHACTLCPNCLRGAVKV